MKRKPVRVLIAFSIIAILAFTGFLYFRGIHAERAFSRGLAAAVGSGHPTVHFRRISSPAWERVFIFGPYTYPEQISAALGFAWHGSDVDTIRSSDGVNLLVFVSHQRVVMSVLHPRNQGDFVPASVGYNYSAEDAEFVIVRRPEDNWLLLAPVPNSRKAPNHALQRTAPRVTVAAIHVRSRLVRAGRCLTSVASFFAPPSQLPRRAPQSLSLGSVRRLAHTKPLRYMGLDSVEIVMGWEEALGVTITDAEATVTRTPRLAIDLLAAKLGAIDDHRGACLTLRAFNRVRRGFVSGAAVHRSAVTPDAKLRDLLPRHQRQARWHAVQAASGLPALPRLGWGFGIILAPTTVADVARSVVCSSPKSLKAPNEPWTRNEIRTVVRTVVTEICGAKDFSDDDDFIYDIGID